MDKTIVNQILKAHFSAPVKCINEASDMPAFQRSAAQFRILSLLQTVCLKVSQKQKPEATENSSALKLISVIETIATAAEDTPPLEGPRRFGNLAFRTFHDKIIATAHKTLSSKYGAPPTAPEQGDPYVELTSYFLGSFGSRQRLDYGTGHELSFLAFFGGLWALGFLVDITGEDILVIFDQYFKLIRMLIVRYNLEPAGSHGVWGLDDHFHLPYILGSAQIVDITQPDTPTPRFSPKTMLRPHVIERECERNLYFSAIAFINKVKRGPFHEHSPILYDITGVATWHKIHRGMVKMYIAEVLGKFPVVQHFWFGTGLYPWIDKDSDEPLPLSEPVEDQSSALNESYLQRNNMPLPTALPGKAPSGKALPGKAPLLDATPVRAPWAR